MLRIIFLFCLVALTLVNAFPGHSHNQIHQLHQLHHARRALTKGQAEKPNDITALGVQSATLSANAPSNSGVGHFLLRLSPFHHQLSNHGGVTPPFEND